MSAFLDALAWLADPAHWTGRQGVPNRVWEHALLTAVPVVAAVLVAVPAGVIAGHRRKGATLGALVVNVGRAVPTLALLILALLLSLALGLGLGFWPSVLAFFLIALHPIFTNSYTAVREVDAATVEAAKGMGMTGREVLLGVELPAAVPVIVAAVRVAAVQVVATAPLAALVAGGGLGRYIVDGFQQRDYAEMLAGILLVALGAVVTEAIFDVVERLATPRGIRRARRDDVAAVTRAV